MRRIIFLLSITLLNISISGAQKISTVEPGEGSLEEAILAADTNDILQLAGGGVYTLSSSSSSFGTIRMPITIQVEPGSSEKAILRLGNNAPTGSKYYFFIVDNGADLTLRGLHIHGLLNNTAVFASLVLFDARPDPSKARFGNFRFENCIFHDFSNNVVHGMKDAYARGSIQDSVFIDNIIVYNSKHFLQYKHVSLKHLEMTNSTVYGLNGMALKIGKIGYRCVLENPNKPYIPLTDETITPTGFIDHCTLDNMGDIHGHIQVDDAYDMLTISNCIFSNQEQYDQPSIYFTEPYLDTAVTIKNTCFWKVGPPNSDVGGINWNGYVFNDTITMDPDYYNDTNGDFSPPLGSKLLTYGTDGGQIGDPRWTARAVGIYQPFKKEELNAFDLANSPNPFSGSTEISFSLDKSDEVSMIVYDSGGRIVVNLIKSYLPAGRHSLVWQSTELDNGVYICRMLAGNQVSVLKLMIAN